MASSRGATEQVLVRVAPDIYAALQLAIPFEGRRSMQELVSAILEDYVASLRHRDPGFQQALAGLHESQTRSADVLARRRVDRSRRRGGSASTS